MKVNKILEWSMISLGTLCVVVGFYFFLEPLKIVIGGFLGITVLLEPFNLMSSSLLLLVLNVVALIVGGFLLGKQFFFRTIYATLLSPLAIFILEQTVSPTWILDKLSSNQLLVASIFGGVLVGVGLGLVIRNNATTGGMDIIQRIINKYLKMPFVVALYLTDGIVIALGMLMDLETGFFAIISMIISSVLIERVAVMGRVSFTFLIITDFADDIKKDIYEVIDRGITKIKVVGGYSNQEKDMILCTLYRQEIYALKEIVLKRDPKAFTLVLNTKEVMGNRFFGNDIT